MFSSEFFLVVKEIHHKYPEIFTQLKEYKIRKNIKKIEHKTRINLTIDPIIYQSFKNFCECNGMKISSKVEQMMKETIKN